MGIAASRRWSRPFCLRRGIGALQPPLLTKLFTFLCLATSLVVLNLPLAGCQVFYSLFPSEMPAPNEDEFDDPEFQSIYQHDTAFRAWYDDYWKLRVRLVVDLRTLNRVGFYKDYSIADEPRISLAQQAYKSDFHSYATSATPRDPLQYAPRFLIDQRNFSAAIATLEKNTKRHLDEKGCAQPMPSGPVSCQSLGHGAGFGFRF